MTLSAVFGRTPRIAAILAALLVLSACMTEKPVIEATGAPVGGA